jgi:hypothetical protein
MIKRILLVGLDYSGPPLDDAEIDTLGLCRPSINKDSAAYALYEYDVIVINPVSYSHFLFGRAGEHSESINELWDLKAENNSYDLDSPFDRSDRAKELSAAIRQGTRVIWLMATPKFTKFFGARTLHLGYVNKELEDVMQLAILHEKKSRRLDIDVETDGFQPYFEQLRLDGWSLCLEDHSSKLGVFARSPEGYCIGGRVAIGDGKSQAWLLTPPSSEKAANILIACAVGLQPDAANKPVYHGIFLSHTSADKSFVRELKSQLETHGVKDVWLDEAEIQIGDSLTKKIEEGLTRTKYIGVVLSPRSIKSSWVERELQVAINREIGTGEVVVLPLLYEKCELPAFLQGKMYADFTSSDTHDENLQKLLRRLKAS